MLEAIILAGGLGTRLRSVVSDLPKCMAPVAGHPFLYYLLRSLCKSNVSHIIFSLGYMHEEVEFWLSHEAWPFEVSFSIEEKPLGTGGAIKQALAFVRGKDVLVLNGDTLFDIDLVKFYLFHKQKNAELSLALKQMRDFDRYGNVEVDEDGAIVKFHEKKECQEGQINGGVYIINKNTSLIPKDLKQFSLEYDVLQMHTYPYKAFGFVSSAYFIDIGIPEDFLKANTDFIFLDNEVKKH